MIQILDTFSSTSQSYDMSSDPLHPFVVNYPFNLYPVVQFKVGALSSYPILSSYLCKLLKHGIFHLLFKLSFFFFRFLLMTLVASSFIVLYANLLFHCVVIHLWSF